ncbi:MAG TPA: peptidase S8, partial [Archangium sp.]
MKRWILASAVLALAMAACTSPSESGETEAKEAPAVDTSRRVLAEEEPGGIVVDFKDGTTEAEFDAWEADWGVDVEFNSVEGQRTGVTIARGVEDMDAALARIRQHPAVESAEPLRVYSVTRGEELVSEEPAPLEDADKDGYTPNDPDYPKQWNLRMIQMPSAWKDSRGKGVVVAVLDTGIAYEDHDDFKQVP